MLFRSSALLGLAALSMYMLEARDAPAHVRLVHASPGDGTVLDHVPDRVVLTLSDGIRSRSTRIELKGPHGSSSLRYEGTGGDPTREVSIPVPDQGGGKYVVRWEIVSTDGDHLGGKVNFAVQMKADARSAATDDQGSR